MTAAMRLAGAVAALGAALIALAVGAAPSLIGSQPWLAAPMVAAGVAQGVIAVLSMRGTDVPPIAQLAVLSAPTVVWIAALQWSPAPEALPLGPLLGASSLALAAAAALCIPTRRAGTTTQAAPLTALLALVGAGAVVAAIATLALAGTEAGRFAVPHGEHGAASPDVTQQGIDLGDETDHSGH